MVKWNYESCREEAAKYKTRTEFARGSSGAYDFARRQPFWSEITSHMELKWSRKWDYESVRKAAADCRSKNEFRQRFPGAYQKAHCEGWFQDLCAHLIHRESRWQTIYDVRKEAEGYPSRSQFALGSPTAYKRALSCGWLDEVCRHMRIEYNGYLHCTYSIVNERLKLAYIGVTSQKFQLRVLQHKALSNGTRSRDISSLGDTKFRQESNYVYTPDEVRDYAEARLIEEYEANGYGILNSDKAVGNVGASRRIWTKQLCKEVALKYASRYNFQKHDSAAHKAALRHGWLDEVCSHMPQINNVWNPGAAREAAAKFDTVAELRSAQSYLYKYLLQNNLMEEVKAGYRQRNSHL
jgi:hypothetical protein